MTSCTYFSELLIFVETIDKHEEYLDDPKGGHFMKTAAKVFIILSMVVIPLSFIIYLIIGLVGLAAAGGDADLQAASMVYIIMAIVSGIWGAACEILGGFSLKKLSTATKKSELTAFGILDIIFVSLIGGILMLCIQDSDLAGNAPVSK